MEKNKIKVKGTVENTKNYFKLVVKSKSGVFGNIYIPKENDLIDEDADVEELGIIIKIVEV